MVSEILFAYASCMANNGQTMAGLNANSPFFHLTTALAMAAGRFGLAALALLPGLFAGPVRFARSRKSANSSKSAHLWPILRVRERSRSGTFRDRFPSNLRLSTVSFFWQGCDRLSRSVCGTSAGITICRSFSIKTSMIGKFTKVLRDSQSHVAV
jgi:Potassium-transporting ATPase A subunit